MIVDDKVGEIESEGILKSSGFAIKTSAKAFRILSSGLYSKKIESIIRELSTNASDAHKEAKQNRPFTVKLPNYLEHNFSIRDYGTGIHPNSIVKVYTTYFESTKTDSNDFTGCLGLGSKSPFCYTDSFDVINYFNGKEYHYTAFISEMGVPTISLLSSRSTKEPNGLMVKFPVKSGDLYQFQADAKKVYTYFEQKPEIIGQPIDLTEKPIFISDKNWTVHEDSSAYDNTTKLVMGNVCYPVKGFGRINYINNSKELILKCDIGEVDITASRVELEYTPKTKATIDKFFNDITKKVSEIIQEEINKQPTYFDAVLFLNKSSVNSANFNYNGELLRSGFKVDDTKFTVSTKKSNYGKKKNINTHTTDTIMYGKHDYILNDTPSGGELRSNIYVRNKNSHEVAYFIELQGSYSVQNFYDDTKIPKDKVILTSYLPKIIRAKNGTGTQKPQIYRFVGRNSYGTDNFGGKIDIVDSLEGVYTISDGYNYKHMSTSKLSALKALGYSAEPYLVPQRYIDKIKKTKLRPYQEVVDEVVNKYLNEKHLIEHLKPLAEKDELLKFKSEITNPKVIELLDKVEKAKDNQKIYHQVRILMDMNQYEEHPDTFDDLQADLPIAHVILRNNLHWGLEKELVEYIKYKS